MATVNLDPEQRKAVATDGNLLVSACPGSGKTRVLSVRGSRLLREGNDTVCAVSFTKDSAEELARRIHEEAGPIAKNRVISGTFHSLCLRQWERSHKVRKIKAEKLRIASQSEIDSIIHKVMLTELEGDETALTLDDAKKMIESGMSRMSQPNAGTERKLVHAYQRELRRAGLVDFATIMLRVVLGMQKGTIDPVPAKFLLVDEGQDMDEVQYTWVLEHAKAKLEVTLVGDDDQCHPGSVEVRMGKGAKPLAALAAFGEGIEFARRSGHNQFAELHLTGGGQYRRSARPYTGPMLTIEAGDGRLPVTPNHRLLVRAAEGHKGWFVLTLCLADDGWVDLRVCPMLDHGRFATISGLDRSVGHRLWVLDYFSASKAAKAEAKVLAMRYGFAIVPRRAKPDATVRAKDPTAGGMQAIEERVDRCLEGFHLDLRHPFSQRTGGGGGKKRGRRPFELTAVNLRPGVFEVPVADRNGKICWQPVNKVDRAAYHGEVHSLEVKPSPLYVANGIVVHNSIYEWRNAMGYDGLERFKKETNASHVVMGRCYRCAPEILKAAGNVIRLNANRQEKQLLSMAAPGGRIRTIQAVDREDELDKIAESVRDAPGDWAVLCRVNSHARLLTGQFQKLGIPFKAAGNDSIWESDAAVSLGNLLVCLGDDDGSRLTQALVWSQLVDHAFLGRAGITPKDSARKVLVTILEAEKARDSTILGDIEPKKLKKLVDLGTRWDQWKRMLQEGESRFPLIIAMAGQWLSNCTPSKSSATILKIAAGILGRYKGTMAQRIVAARDYASKKGTEEDTGPKVSVLTLHSSKGLEFPRVWIMGAEEKVLPHSDGILSEERRLAYVGMTRGKRELVVSWTLGEESKLIVSRFVIDAGLWAA